MEGAAEQTYQDDPHQVVPDRVTHAEMNAAYDTGAAVPLARSIPWLTRYSESWWVVYEDGWLRITDELTTADIDSSAARLRAAEVIDASEHAREQPCPPLP